MILRAPVHLLGASAVTVWPVILVSPLVEDRVLPALLTHEGVHLAQQRRWALYGFGVGLLLWWALYLLALPYGWNPWRRRWEVEAFRAEGISDDEIERVLRGRPYFLTLG